jgi:hypothetical protein
VRAFGAFRSSVGGGEITPRFRSAIYSAVCPGLLDRELWAVRLTSLARARETVTMGTGPSRRPGHQKQIAMLTKCSAGSEEKDFLATRGADWAPELRLYLERTTGFEPATLTLAIRFQAGWRGPPTCGDLSTRRLTCTSRSRRVPVGSVWFHPIPRTSVPFLCPPHSGGQSGAASTTDPCVTAGLGNVFPHGHDLRKRAVTWAFVRGTVPAVTGRCRLPRGPLADRWCADPVGRPFTCPPYRVLGRGRRVAVDGHPWRAADSLARIGDRCTTPREGTLQRLRL